LVKIKERRSSMEEKIQELKRRLARIREHL